ncbi:MAG: hypothetical protein QOJ29_2348 [Thermoleophilaceae bacterium]|jgi:hypothetical protein|nr:hypothetical protein [Thermoleophilaceae bacterium]
MPRPSVAKNQMGRAVNAIVDPWPRSKDPVWEYFESRCAYCGIALSKAERKGHIDHATASGGNHLGNLVLACANCNGDEKLDADWRDFLAQKVSDPRLRQERVAKIEAWQDMHPKPEWAPTDEVEAIQAELQQMIVAFGVKCAELRKAVADAKAAATRADLNP